MNKKRFLVRPSVQTLHSPHQVILRDYTHDDEFFQCIGRDPIVGDSYRITSAHINLIGHDEGELDAWVIAHNDVGDRAALDAISGYSIVSGQRYRIDFLQNSEVIAPRGGRHFAIYDTMLNRLLLDPTHIQIFFCGTSSVTELYRSAPVTLGIEYYLS